MYKVHGSTGVEHTGLTELGCLLAVAEKHLVLRFLGNLKAQELRPAEKRWVFARGVKVNDMKSSLVICSQLVKGLTVTPGHWVLLE